MTGSLELLLVEDSAADRERLVTALSSQRRDEIALTHAVTLRDAIERVQHASFDLVLLDLELPDSQGLDTFAQLHLHDPTLPILVLTSPDHDEQVGRAALESGAQDFLSKADLERVWLTRAIRHALERSRLERELRKVRLRSRRLSEIADVGRLSQTPGTMVTASIYSSGSLRTEAPAEFEAAVAAYVRALELALEQLTYKEAHGCSDALHELATQLGFLRASPRDVIEVHTSALRTLVVGSTPVRVNAYVEESRLTVLELMGNLAGYYRNFYHPRRSRGEQQ